MKKTNKKKTASPKKEEFIGEANKALESINKKEKLIDELNSSVLSQNYSELSDFVIRFSQTKDCQLMFRLLARIQDQPQVMCGENEFQTIVNAARIDGERHLVTKFAQLVTHAMDGDRLSVDRKLVRNPIL